MVRPLHTSSGAKQEAEPAAVSSNSQAAAYGASAPSAANASYHYAMHSHQQAGYHQMMHHHPHHPSMSNGSHSGSNSPPTVNGASQSHAAASPSSRLPPVVHSGVDQHGPSAPQAMHHPGMHPPPPPGYVLVPVAAAAAAGQETGKTSPTQLGTTVAAVTPDTHSAHHSNHQHQYAHAAMYQQYHYAHAHQQQQHIEQQLSTPSRPSKVPQMSPIRNVGTPSHGASGSSVSSHVSSHASPPSSHLPGEFTILHLSECLLLCSVNRRSTHT